MSPKAVVVLLLVLVFLAAASVVSDVRRCREADGKIERDGFFHECVAR